ncbi:DUF669 domain-containing protein [Methylobacterium sp. WCS2018Hpa-22]|uniref:DUF669 domain-containing protein n=1 Tax=Methylobacterium sp. WCS2018Hpa-22 TaxID=3073633 RepID=UPI002889BA16|nr:DUF669 domain-containing protein [Methylobacterium sp. WCS2018Hpa-22]
MADLGFSLSVDDVIETPDFEPMPEGDYELQIVEADVRANSKGTGSLLEYKAEVVSGEFEGKSIFERINIRHENATAQAIGQKALQDLIKAAGVRGVSDTDELLYKPFFARVAIEAYKSRNGEDRTRNVVKGYLYEGAPTPPESKPAATPAATPRSAPTRPAANSASGGSKLPWKKPS